MHGMGGLLPIMDVGETRRTLVFLGDRRRIQFQLVLIGCQRITIAGVLVQGCSGSMRVWADYRE